MTEYRVVIFGTLGVGKSCLTIQFVQNHFVDDYDPTIEDSYRKHVTIDDEPYLLDILDTAGADDYSPGRDSCIRGGQGFLYIYSITSRRSFEGLRQFYNQVLERKGPEVPMVLVGNKWDLREERQVSVVEGQDLAITLGCPYFETSAKDGSNVAAPFYSLVREIRMRRQGNNPLSAQRERKKSCGLL